MNLLLFGAPGAGKGTQSALLVERSKMVHLSTGDLFRAAVKAGTPLGLKAKAFLDRGELVPDSIVVDMVKEKVSKLGDQEFVLDGFPRTLPQAEALTAMLQETGTPLSHVVSLEVPQELLVERLSGRRVCAKCGAVYHLSGKPPAEAGKCDLCGGEVVQRSDDREDAIRVRLDLYRNQTEPLKDYYREKGLLREVDGTGTTEGVFSKVHSVLFGRGFEGSF